MFHKRLILGIDFGTKNIGISRADLGLKIAFPVSIIDNNKNINLDILDLCKENNIKKVIVGLPKLPSGNFTRNTENAMVFAENLEDFFLSKKFNIPVDFFDERFSSVNVKKNLKNIGVKLDKIDDLSSASFLQTYLDSL